MRKLPETLSIGEVAQRTGMRTSALRYYESIGLLPVQQRVGGQRRYPQSTLRHIGFIQTAQQVGFSLEETKMLLGGTDKDTPFSERMQDLARRKLRDVEQLIARATAMKRILESGIACECMRLEDCVIFMPPDEARSTERCCKNGHRV